LYGTFLTCKYGIPGLIKDGGGSVINFSSINAFFPQPAKTCYVAAKGGVISMTKMIAADYGRQGIRANAIAPGRTLTPRTRPRHEATGGLSDKLGSRHLLGLVEPSDIADLAVYLASDESRKITAQTFLADSGASIG
jgi:NAD(P)-dependent dehydrogenase (short-subunit alcohol dehydrogenase family)